MNLATGPFSSCPTPCRGSIWPALCQILLFCCLRISSLITLLSPGHLWSHGCWASTCVDVCPSPSALCPALIPHLALIGSAAFVLLLLFISVNETSSPIPTPACLSSGGCTLPLGAGSAARSPARWFPLPAGHSHLLGMWVSGSLALVLPWTLSCSYLSFHVPLLLAVTCTMKGISHLALQVFL